MRFDFFGVVKIQNSVSVAMFYFWLMEAIVRCLVTWLWAGSLPSTTSGAFSMLPDINKTCRATQNKNTNSREIWALNQMDIKSKFLVYKESSVSNAIIVL